MRQYKTVYGLLKNPERWTRGATARTKRHGAECLAQYGSTFCLLGATQRVYGHGTPKETRADDLIDQTIRALYPRFSTTNEFNDARSTTHQDVLRVVRKAGV